MLLALNITEIFNIFLLGSALLGFCLSLFMFFSKYGKDRSLLFLNLMILTIALNNFQSWALALNLLQHKFMLSYIQIPWHFLSGPFFYAFLVNYLDIVNHQKKLLKYFLGVFLIMCIAQISFVINYTGGGTIDELNYIYERYTSIEELISFISSISIFVYSYYVLRNKENLFQKILSFDNLKWIYNFFKLTGIVYLLWVFALVIKFSLNFSGFIYSYYPLRVSTTVIIFILGYQGIKYLRILKERKHIREENENEITDTLIQEDKEPASKYEEHFLNIDSFVRTNKKFLQPKYTLNNLSKEVNIGTSTLSAIINNNAKKSFVDYINEMRVDQAKKFLLNPKYEGYTIASIGLESGFNSKSAFYDVFKKHTGCTPLAFKNSNI
ncbi:helix-turn-helix domain-containing protein [Tenacibaculum jejuense]|uniref:Putative Transcriptional regulator (AraC family) protein n=1 Tax=Tenacibaculum jejuense TaxID=584609 RepID=A0A238U844_9FLAO|nr:helix-turn-helix domain-containing protein [Tenacibaculum jejuense]SNR15205.1 putative Transcriptional regulator (AraC family) protein [Tenacibaculum jejuense]